MKKISSISDKKNTVLIFRHTTNYPENQIVSIVWPLL